MKTNSLAFRLIASSAAIAAVLLLAAAILLNGLFQQALERNFDAQLRAVLDRLTANVDVAPDGKLTLLSQVADTRFELPMSGWYWQVSAPGENPASPLASPSLLEKRLAPQVALLSTRDSDGTAAFYMQDGKGNNLRAIEQNLEVIGKKGFSFLVTGNFDDLGNEVQAFRRILYLILSLLGLGLLAAVFAQVRYGLKPMQAMQQNLNDIRAGKSEKLDGQFPAEMQAVADELNLLITANAEVLERSRTQVGNLAHALKTPLSVLTNEAGADSSQLASKVSQQVAVMRDQVNLYLDRARRAATAKALGSATEVEPVLQALARTLQRINRDRAIAIEVSSVPNLRFRGEKQDLEEMLGNLMENACKWASTSVSVRALSKQVDGRQRLLITIDDDGPGIPLEKRHLALKRGQRLDESKPGSGLGLHIVTETAGMYGGNLELADSPTGGLSCSLNLPAI